MQLGDRVRPRPRSAAATRRRILDAADELFYAQGIRSTSADRIIARAGITKVTFYRHFRTKNDLAVAYLQRQASAEREWLTALLRPGRPAASLRILAVAIGAAGAEPGFRGCAFINAAAEFPDPRDPVRAVVDEHRSWMHGVFAQLAADVGAADAVAAAHQLMILRDGAMVNGYIGDPASVAQPLAAAFESVIEAAGGSMRPR